MNWKKLANEKSKKAFLELMANGPDGLERFSLASQDNEYKDVREKLLEIDKVAHAVSDRKLKHAYLYDLEFGLRMYDYLTSLGIGVWQAADNGFWAYLSIRVIPDIVAARWGGLNEDRFYKRNWRIWLKSLWWYIHLTECGDDETFDMGATREMLKDNSQDIIYLLLDHVGDGFRDTLYHVLMKHYYEVCRTTKIKGSREDFCRAIMLQHQIRSTVVDPVLEGEKAYVEGLFNRVLPSFTEK